jgi:hypothetical protein
MFTKTDIKWIKNITRDHGANLAYMEYEVGDILPLNFSKNPKWYPTNYGKAKPGELMALFQTLLPGQGVQEGKYVTHLVTPIDNLISVVDNPMFPYVRLMCVVGRANFNHQIDENVWSFFKCNRGQICYLNTIERRSKPDFLDEEKHAFIWNLFDSIQSEVDVDIKILQRDDLPDIEIMSAEEGAERTFLKMHKIRERNATIIAEAKQLAKAASKLYCEVCTFDFEREYPAHGDGFIECHHKQPISVGGIRTTTVNDLALVCSNCHRMLHKKNLKGEYYTTEQLKELVEQTI